MWSSAAGFFHSACCHFFRNVSDSLLQWRSTDCSVTGIDGASAILSLEQVLGHIVNPAAMSVFVTYCCVTSYPKTWQLKASLVAQC